MSETFISQFTKRNRQAFLKYRKYVENNPWHDTSIESSLKDEFFNEYYSDDPTQVRKAEISKMMKELLSRQKNAVTEKTNEFNLQSNMMYDILDRLKYFVKRTQGDHHRKDFKKFVKECFSIIEIHTNRTDEYVNSFDIEKIENQEVRTEEMSFIRLCFSGLTKIQDKITELNIKDDDTQTVGIEFLNGMKAPLSMHHILKDMYPEINRKLAAMKIDFESEPEQTLHILNPNPPIWDVTKHYFDQNPKTLQYYVDQFKILRDGCVIDGYYISGWMYYHMNVFVTPIPHKVLNKRSGKYENKDIIINPPLRDSDVIIFENHEKQKEEKYLFMFIAATRRAAKTTLESSKLGHAMTIGKKELLCAGGSAKDLNQIAKNVKTDIQYKNAAFAVYNVSNDFKDKIELGLKTKSNKTILLSTLHIVNTDSGKNVEVLAGYTPDEFLYDEAMKGEFIEALQGLKPAMKGTEGMIRCFGILSATGGDEDLSADGISVLNNPEGFQVLPMDWDKLERGVPEEYKTWQEDRSRSFSTFIPGQCCVDMPKIDSTLADYIGKPECEGLRKIKLKVTDWENATKTIQETREKLLGNELAYNKEVVYIPLTPSDIMRSGTRSPWPLAEAKAHKEYLLRTGLWDRRRDLYRDSSGKICCEPSNKPLAPYPHKGGTIDAPALIFEDFPIEKPKFGTYTAGFDDIKQISASSSSITTFYVMKNKILGDPFSEKIVASISFRPDRKDKIYEQWLMLMEAYNLEGTCFGENEDFTIKDYLDKLHLSDKYLADSLDFSKTFNIPNNLRRTKGWNPSTTKKHVHELFVDYCNQQFQVEDEDGKIITLKGVQRIDDIGLLEEIIHWSPNANCDRLVAVYGSYAYLHYMNSSMRWKVKNYENPENRVQNKEEKPREKQFYSGNGQRRNFYRKR